VEENGREVEICEAAISEDLRTYDPWQEEKLQQWRRICGHRI
jgi:hypothetical protein